MSNVDSFFWVWLNENLYKSRSQPLEFFRGQDSGWDRLKPSLESFSKFLDRSTLEKLGKKWEGLDRLAYKEMLSLSLRGGVRLVTFQDEGYPPLLREIPDPPLALFVKGALRVFSRCVAVAGTRNPSAYGHRMAGECGKALAEKGYIVVSGLARGIDTEAHIGTLEGGGKTVAVLAGDVEKVYPPENKRIAEDIVRNGAIVSETPPNVSIDKRRFVRRNRITSGISICLVVVESPGRGGTSTQVDHALAQGRRVFVMVPEKGHSDLREGFEEYLSRGAEPFGDTPEMISCIEEVSSKVDRRETKGQRQLDVFSR